MPGESCPIPSGRTDPAPAVVLRMINARRIAVVGASDDPSRPSSRVVQYLLSARKEVVPVNPTHQSVMGLRCYPSLAVAPSPIEIVIVFRRPEFCPEVVRQAITAGASGVWLQSGIISAESRELARQAGIDFVQNRCWMVEHMHHTRGV